jgi:septum formation protein
VVALSLTHPSPMSHGSENPLTHRAALAPFVADLPRIHLASTSPRRRELLTTAGILHDAAHPGLDDAQLSPGSVDPERWVMALAYLKAASAVRTLPAHAAPIVLAADTVVVHDGLTSSAPADLDDARRMLHALRNSAHDVLTGVALIDSRTGRRDIFADRAVVTVGHISDEEIESYLASGLWKGKAGAYNLSERLAAGWPITFSGDSGTIMGLPVAKLVDRLRAFVARAA